MTDLHVNMAHNWPKLINYFTKLTSTNDHLKKMLLDKKYIEGTSVVTFKQTKGKGQPGNVWESEEGKNLTFSILLFPDFIQIQSQFLISQVVSLGIIECLKTIGVNATIKWPNDIYYNNDKIAGVLIENTIMLANISESIVGIGLNVNQLKFSEKIPHPTSIGIITKNNFNLTKLLAQLLNSINHQYSRLQAGHINDIRTEYLKNLYRGKGMHLFKDETGIFKACIHQIAGTGIMTLKTENQEYREYAFKEVSFVF